MATVNFSVPDDVKKEFDAEFEGRNKSAIVAELMRKAVEDERIRRRRSRAIAAILKMRERIKPITEDEFRRLREAGRP